MGLSDACAKSIESTDPLPAELRNFQLRNSHDRCEGAPALFGGCSMSGDVPGSSPIQGGPLAPYPITQAMWRGLNGAGGSFDIPGRTSFQVVLVDKGSVGRSSSGVEIRGKGCHAEIS